MLGAATPLACEPARFLRLRLAPLASGAKVYRLEIIGGSASYAVYGFGEFRLRKVPA